MLIECIMMPVTAVFFSDIVNTVLRKPMVMCTMIVLGSLLFRLAAEQIERSILLLNSLQVPHTDWTDTLISHPYLHFGLLIFIAWIDLIIFNVVKQVVWYYATLPRFMTHPLTNVAWFRFNNDAALAKDMIKDVTDCAETLRVLNMARCKLSQPTVVLRRQDARVQRNHTDTGENNLVRTQSKTRAGTPFKTYSPVSAADTVTPMFSPSSSSLWSSTVSTRWTTRASTPGRDSFMASGRSSRSMTPMPGHNLHPAAGDSMTQLLPSRMMSSVRSARRSSPATPPLSHAHLHRAPPYADYPCTLRLSTVATAAGSPAVTSQREAHQLNIGADTWVMASYTGTSKTVKKFVGKVLSVEEDDVLVTFCRYKRGVCIWPMAEDKGWMSRGDLEVIRPPTFDRRDRMIFPEDVLNMMG